jgi:HD-GYP domain-containing protein (c-di-GMP phosphodiesterase class II)
LPDDHQGGYVKLFTVDPRSIPLGRALEFSLRSEDGVLLVKEGTVIAKRRVLETLAQHGKLYVDVREAHAYYGSLARSPAEVSKPIDVPGRSHPNQTQVPLRLSAVAPHDPALDTGEQHIDWLGLQARAHAILRFPQRDTFLPQITSLQHRLSHLVRHSPDATLLALTHLAAEESDYYSATHALFVCALCTLAAHDVLHWPQSLESPMGLAALTMNISMTALQDKLAVQTDQLSSAQQSEISSHAQRSADLLESLGVTDPLWLGAVARHHADDLEPVNPDAAGATPAAQISHMAHLIHRADTFAACISPRASRAPLPSSEAMREVYFDGLHHVDEAGASLVKVMGIHPPGMLVSLENKEVAVVVHRAPDGLHPTVAVLINRHGMPLAEPVIRDTRHPGYGIVATISHQDVKVRTDLLRLLAVA